LNANPFYLMNYVSLGLLKKINEWMEYPFDIKVVKYIFNFVLFLNLWSYFACAFKAPVAIQKKTEVADPKQFCVHCNNWKPERAHHCSICNKCIPKMDHHCPWLGNCIGYHNLKMFYLFCFY